MTSMVSFTFCLKRAPRLFSTQIHAPSRTPKRLQSSGLTMMSGSGMELAHGGQLAVLRVEELEGARRRRRG